MVETYQPARSDSRGQQHGRYRLHLLSDRGTGAHTINVGSALPTISGTVILDASTDDSFAANGNRPAIVLDGNNTGSAGLTLTASGNTVRGFVIRDFNSGGITINSANNTIVGNWIGSYNTDGSDAVVQNPMLAMPSA